MEKLKIALVAAFSLDVLTTGYAFTLGAVEANPVMAGLSGFEIGGLKGVVLGGVLSLCRGKSKWSRAVLGYGAFVTGAVSLWNLYQILAYGLVVA